MTQDVSPIITSLLDTDAYKLHMQQAVYHRYRNVSVAAEFRCRGDELLGEYAGEIANQVNLMGQLALTQDEYDYLAALPFFQRDYLDWLRTLRLDPRRVAISNDRGRLNIRISGPWREVILWEVPLLAVISEVVHRHRSPHITPEVAAAQLQRRLSEFRHLSADVDSRGFHLIDFGTRRRFSRAVHQAILTTLKSEFPYLSGTSNYLFAKQMALTPLGTQAHEWFQAHQQICPVLANSQRAALQSWLDEYPDQLGIALTDCITMDAFLRDFSSQFAGHYQGLRHDSGDPIAWGEKAIAHYEQLGLDPQDKMLVFSDNLDLPKALALYRHFHHRINLSFGIGTRLTCDLPGVRPLNIVIKLVECNGKPVAKLSDSPGKTICQDAAFVKALRKAFDLPLVKRAS
ncbi:nicotinate phosphoribosyltransferase [Edwardsiella ictaluri]|uniref:nicotinate phosphoribosyltransferase n=1 Tax=Edwardsiella ictaluri TaxID=67780 RepID=UPI0037850AEA